MIGSEGAGAHPAAASGEPAPPDRRAAARRWGERALAVALSLGVGLLPMRQVAEAGGPGEDGVLAQLTGTAETVILVGEGVDLTGTLWTYDHVDRMLRGEVGPLRGDLFHPFGFDSAVAQGMGWLDAVLAWPLVALLGVPAFYDLHLVLVLAAGCLATIALLRTVGGPMPVALALATVIWTSPWVALEVQDGRVTQVHLVFPLLFLLLLARHLDGRGRGWALGLGAGACLAAACLVYWFHGMAVGLLGALVAATRLALDPPRRPAILAGGALLAATALSLATAAAWPAIAPLLAASADLAAQAARRPVEPQPLLAGLRATGLPLSLPALGLLGLLALLRGGARPVAPWALALALTLTLPLATPVELAGRALPSALVLLRDVLPLFHRLGFPNRLAVAPMLAGACAAAAAAGVLLRAVPAGRLRLLAGGGLAALVLALGLAERPAGLRAADVVQRVRVDPFQARALYEPASGVIDGPIIDVPLLASNTEYAYQLLHRQPLLGGPGIDGPNTRPAAHLAYVQGNSFLAALEAAARGQPVPAWSPEDRKRLVRDGFTTVIVHDWYEGIDSAGVDALLGRPAYKGQRRAVYRLDGEGARRRSVRPGRSRDR